jgi:hypothetical protein
MRFATIALVMIVAFAGLRGVASAADVRGTVQQAPAVNAAFVNAAFQVLYNRPATAADVAYWMSPAMASQGQAGVVQAMLNTPAFRQLEINALFQHFLGRPATSADMAFYGSGAMTMAQVAAAIMGSPAYYATAGGTIAGFLSKVYSDALGYPINTQAMTYVNGQFTSTQGISSASFATYVEQSSSGSAYLTVLLAQNVLHHDSAPSGGTLVAAALAAITQLM